MRCARRYAKSRLSGGNNEAALRFSARCQGAVSGVMWCAGLTTPMPVGLVAVASRSGSRGTCRPSDSLGRAYFAGEHTAISYRGMEGAMESGERAALEVARMLS